MPSVDTVVCVIHECIICQAVEPYVQVAKRDTEMKIYTQDNSWRGSIVVVAESEEEARELMAVHVVNYEPTEPIEAHEIVKGFCFANYGDS